MNEGDQNWILNYLSIGKGVVPYEKIKSYRSLNSKPDGEFFNMIGFYNSFKNKIITDKKTFKKLFIILKMRNIGDLNDLFNFQDTIILCEVFESRALIMNKKYKNNPRRCNSASTLWLYPRNQSKIIILLPTNAEIVELFKNMLIRGFSSVSTPPTFDINILMPNLENNSETIKRKNLKVGHIS